mmetsp:Transcript_32292/g.54747  ORF Transcript_32292/g.54747 Transcript_32292/m.54747 type:complete len:299 (-) Transcript_32292:582-1478(-)
MHSSLITSYSQTLPTVTKTGNSSRTITIVFDCSSSFSDVSITTTDGFLTATLALLLLGREGVPLFLLRDSDFGLMTTVEVAAVDLVVLHLVDLSNVKRKEYFSGHSATASDRQSMVIEVDKEEKPVAEEGVETPTASFFDFLRFFKMILCTILAIGGGCFPSSLSSSLTSIIGIGILMTCSKNSLELRDSIARERSIWRTTFSSDGFGVQSGCVQESERILKSFGSIRNLLLSIKSMNPGFPASVLVAQANIRTARARTLESVYGSRRSPILGRHSIPIFGCREAFSMSSAAVSIADL